MQCSLFWAWKHLLKMDDELEKIFPKIYHFITKKEHSSGGGYMDYLSVIAALYGYNTIKGPSGITSKENKNNLDDVDYYTTTDRKALTISNEVEVRNKDRKKDEETYDDNKNEDSFDSGDSDGGGDD